MEKQNFITQEEHQEIIRVCGEDYEWNDIPAYMKKRLEYSEDYPIGGSIEPYDIETEKELLKNK